MFLNIFYFYSASLSVLNFLILNLYLSLYSARVPSLFFFILFLFYFKVKFHYRIFIIYHLWCKENSGVLYICFVFSHKAEFYSNSNISVNYYRFSTHVNDVFVFSFLLITTLSFSSYVMAKDFKVIILSLIEMSLKVYYFVVQLLQILL